MIINVLFWIYYIFTGITAVFGLYYVISGVIGLLKRKSDKKADSDRINYFAILIAARNESCTIGNLVHSLTELDYPKDRYDIYVIPNNCTDDTETAARKAGANIIECTVPTKTKADVLRFAFDKLKDETYIDSYLIFDADNVVDRDFLSHMNNSLNNGYRVAQGYREAKNSSDSWITGCYTLFYLFQNVFFNRPRKNLNVSSSINGTGLMIKKSLIDERGFPTVTLTEDIEFTGFCALDDEKIDFVEDAVTYDEYPVSFGSSWKQRRRWISGMIDCMKQQSGKLIGKAFRDGSMAAFDIGITFLTPVMQPITVFNTVLMIVLMLLKISDGTMSLPSFILGTAGSLLLAYFVVLIAEIFVLKYKSKSLKSVFLGLILFPIFLLTWIPIQFICFFGKKKGWEEIKHDRNIRIEDMEK